MKKYLIKSQVAVIAIVLLVVLATALGMYWRSQQNSSLHNIVPTPIGSNISE